MTPPSRQKQAGIELRLYIAGQAPGSVAALANVRGICEERFAHDYSLEVIDVLKEPLRAREDEVFALPTLVRRSPMPVLRLIGNLAVRERVLAGILPRE